MSRRERISSSESEDNTTGFRHRTRDVARDLLRTRTLIKSDKPLPEGALQGSVITSVGTHWIVAVGEIWYVCMVSGTLDVPHTGTLIAVGNIVWIIPADRQSDDPLFREIMIPGMSPIPGDNDSRNNPIPGDNDSRNEADDPTGTIVRVEERVTLLSRKAAGRVMREQVLVANVDQLAVVVSFVEPNYHRRLIDRYLIAADKGDLKPIIVLNKVELIPHEYLQDIVDDFEPYSKGLGIDVHFVSAATGGGLDTLRQALSGRSTLFSGPSGVGKSTIINTLTDGQLRVGAVSRKYEKGRHTTTAAVSIPVDEHSSVVDSPGLREFAIWELDANELPWYFEEFTSFIEQCHYTPCTHTHEPGCAVKGAVEKGLIDEGRYESYVLLRNDLLG